MSAYNPKTKHFDDGKPQIIYTLSNGIAKSPIRCTHIYSSAMACLSTNSKSSNSISATNISLQDTITDYHQLKTIICCLVFYWRLSLSTE